MTSEVQLGRSVLESKERTELQAIAEQLSVKTTSSMKKGDLIDGILSAAGVGESAAPSPEATIERAAPAPATRDEPTGIVEDAAPQATSAAAASSLAPEGSSTPETDSDDTPAAPGVAPQ